METNQNQQPIKNDTLNRGYDLAKGISRSLLWVALIGIIALWFIFTRNSFVTKALDVDNKFSLIDTQLQRRYDLIPNLVETVKGVAKQEQDVFGNIAQARSKYAGSISPEEKLQASEEVESALARLLVITENYPQLRSSESFQNLMVQLEGTENRINFARTEYSNTVTAYNKAIVRFPANIVAKILGYKSRPVFSATVETRENPQVNFSK